MLVGVLPAIIPQSSAHAASAYLADENGQTEITVDVNDDFQVVLYVVDISGVAGYECKITVSGPATPIDSAVHGAWFADGHTIFDGIDPVPADYHTAMLLSPLSISGSGAVVVFTLHADEEGTVAINVDSEYFLFAESDGDLIELDLPSTLYVSVLEGDGLSGGGEEAAETAGDESGDGFLDSIQYTLTVNSTPITGISITATPESAGDDTDYPKSIDENTQITLTAPASFVVEDPAAKYTLDHWTLGGVDQPYLQDAISFKLTGDITAVAVYRRTLYVAAEGGDYTTIQDAITAASNGWVVIVTQGNYTGPGNRDITFQGKAITVRSTDPFTEGTVDATVVDCDGSEEFRHRGFLFITAETSDSVLEGITITKAYGDVAYNAQDTASGGAIRCSNSSPTIRYNSLINNKGWHGGSIVCWQSDAVIMGNRIFNNHVFGCGAGVHIAAMPDAQTVWTPSIIGNQIGYNGLSYDQGGIFGGGIFIEGPCYPLVLDNNILFNSSSSMASGGGMYCDSACIISGNRIIGNHSDAGCGIFLRGRTGTIYPVVSNNLIVGNGPVLSGSSTFGGGVLCYLPNKPLLLNNTIAFNRAVAKGGGVFVWDSEVYSDNYPTLKNCILYGNIAQTGLGNEVAVEGSFATVAISYSNIPGGEAGVHLASGATVDWREGNLDEEPLFRAVGSWTDPKNTPTDWRDDDWVDTGADYHLMSTIGRYQPGTGWVQDEESSPCIDAGEPPSPDNDNFPNEPQPRGFSINMGAYGNTPEASKAKWRIPGDADGNCLVNILDLIKIRAKMAKDPLDGDNWRADVNEDGRINILDLIFVRNRLNQHCE